MFIDEERFCFHGLAIERNVIPLPLGEGRVGEGRAEGLAGNDEIDISLISYFPKARIEE